MAGKSLGKTVMGWFVEEVDGSGEAVEAEEQPSEEVEARPSPPRPKARAKAPPRDEAPLSIDELEELPAELPDPGPPPVHLEGELPSVGETGDVDFRAVYGAAGIPSDAQERVDRAVQLLRTLPVETPKEIKKQIVEASLKAFGFPVDHIIESGVQEIQALESFIRRGARDTQDALGAANAEIARLQGKIAEIKKLMEQKLAQQQLLTRSSNTEKLRVQEVLEFFGQEAVARVVRESPKIVEQ